MGRRKLVIKPIEDKNSRQVTFSKRRNGLIKKASELSVLCQVDVALLVFSRTGKLYQFCSGGNSLSDILERYGEHILKAEDSKDESGMMASAAAGRERQWSNEGLLQRLLRHLESLDTEKLDLIDIVQLEKLLDSVLLQTRTRKTQLMIESAAAHYNQETILRGGEGNHKHEEEMTRVVSSRIGCLDEVENPHQVATFRWMQK